MRVVSGRPFSFTFVYDVGSRLSVSEKVGYRCKHEGGRPRGLWGGAGGAAGGPDRCAPGPAVPRRTRAERRGAAARRQHGARACARGLRAAAERAPTARVHAAHADMDALSDDDEFARREPQVRHLGLCLHPAELPGDHILTAAEGRECPRNKSPGCGAARVQERPWWEPAPRGLAPVSVRLRERLLRMINFVC